MKIGLCSYSGYKIYPGHGRRLVKTDGKVFNFLSSRCLAAHLLKRNPRECRWTVFYRRKHKKGTEEETVKKRTRKTVKYQRAIAGTSLTELLAKRNQKPEVRKAAREQAIRAAKEKQRANQAAKKPAQVAAKKPTQVMQKAVKVTQKTAPRVGGKR